MGDGAMRKSEAVQSSYLLNNADAEAPVRFAGLSALFDADTIRHLERRGVDRGWSCLEVGAGSGSIARWLADRVGAAGRVLATDIDPRHLQSLKLPNLEVQRHDISADPLPEGHFDLVHARLVLMHLARREEVLARLIAALKPGGWLLDEEYDCCSMPPDPAVSPGEVLLQTQTAMWRLMRDHGVDVGYGRLLFGRMRAHGLVDVGAEGRLLMSHHGSPGASILLANATQLGPQLIGGNYITRQQLDEDLRRLDDPDFMGTSPILWSAWGRRR